MTDTPTPRQAATDGPESASRGREGAGRPPGPSQALRGAVEGSGAARPLTDAELLAWSVVLAWRDACYTRGATFLLPPYPPCPTCGKVVHGIATYRSAARCDMRLSVRPCEHVHAVSDDQMDRIHRHAADMIHNIDIDERLDFGKRWRTDDIINEALARTTPDNSVTSSDGVDNPVIDQPDKPRHPDGNAYSYAELQAGNWGFCAGCRMWSNGTVQRPHQCPATHVHGPVANDGPSIAEAAADDRNWDVEKEGE